MSNYAIKVLSCSRHGRISYLSAETLHNLSETLQNSHLSTGRLAAGLADLGYLALEHDYYYTALELFRKTVSLILPRDADIRNLRVDSYRRHYLMRAATGLDTIWHRLGERDSKIRRDIVETLAEIHYARLGLDYWEIVSELNDY